jgi:hypothetical protein
MTTTINDRIDHILNDPCASYWLKDAVRLLLKRDPVDAASDAVLAALFADRCD